VAAHLRQHAHLLSHAGRFVGRYRGLVVITVQGLPFHFFEEDGMWGRVRSSFLPPGGLSQGRWAKREHCAQRTQESSLAPFFLGTLRAAAWKPPRTSRRWLPWRMPRTSPPKPSTAISAFCHYNSSPCTYSCRLKPSSRCSAPAKVGERQAAGTEDDCGNPGVVLLQRAGWFMPRFAGLPARMSWPPC
jgi:hypothetical protein